MESPLSSKLDTPPLSETQWLVERLNLLEQLDDQQQLLEERDELLKNKQDRIELLEETIRLMRHRQFGASSEKHIDQAELFNEAELLDCETERGQDEAESDDDSASVKKKKASKRGRKPIPPELPRVPIYITLPDEEKAGVIDTFFEVVKEEVDIIPAQIQVLEYHQEKVVLPDEDGERTIKSAPLPAHIIGKAMASAGLLAFVIVSKYADGLPLHRLERILQRYGIDITRATLANWVIRTAIAVQPLINLLRDHSLSGPIIFADETTIQVLKEPDKPPDSQSQMWVQVGGTEEQRVILFDYDASRSKSVPLRLFEGYEGHGLQTDGYAGYNAVCEQEGLTQFGCWDHARRKLKDAKNAEPKGKKRSSQPTKADMGLSYVRKLYAVEKAIPEKSTPTQTVAYRQEHATPILDQLRKWLDKTLVKTDPGGKTGMALKYIDNQWDKLTNYTECGHARISNCLAENAIRPYVIGRKAWLFSDTPKGAHASATLYGLIETAKANGLEPYHYLHHVFKELPRAETVEQIEQLLPWHVDRERLQRYSRGMIDAEK